MELLSLAYNENDLNHSGTNIIVLRLPTGSQLQGVILAERYANGDSIPVTIVVDVASIEIYFDGGLTVMTNLFFASEPMESLKVITHAGAINLRELEVRRFHPFGLGKILKLFTLPCGVSATHGLDGYYCTPCTRS